MAKAQEKRMISPDTKLFLDGLAKVGREKTCELEYISGLMSGLIIKEIGEVDAEFVENLRLEIGEAFYGSVSLEEIFERPYINLAVEGKDA